LFQVRFQARPQLAAHGVRLVAAVVEDRVDLVELVPREAEAVFHLARERAGRRTRRMRWGRWPPPLLSVPPTLENQVRAERTDDHAAQDQRDRDADGDESAHWRSHSRGSCEPVVVAAWLGARLSTTRIATGRSAAHARH